MIVGTPTKLNLIPSGVMPVVYINQGDAGYDKEFLIYNGDTPYNVPSGVSATIRGTKADNYGVTEAAAVTAGSNLVTVTITEQMVAAAGKNVYELVFVDTNDLRVASINMVWAVKKDALGDSVISDSDLDYASQVLNQLQSVQAFKNQLDTNTADIETNTDGLAAETAARIAADATLQSNINTEASTRAATDTSLQAQINQLVAPSGAAPSAAEVQNARIGADGVTYSALGDAIRTQVTNLKGDILNRPKAMADGIDINTNASMITGLYLYTGETVIIDVSSINGNVNCYINGYSSTNVLLINAATQYKYTAANDGYLRFFFLNATTLSAKIWLDSNIYTVENDVVSLKRAAFRTGTLALEVGGLDTGNGGNVTNNARLRTSGFIGDDIVALNFDSGSYAYVFGYRTDGTYVGVFTGSGWTTNWQLQTKLYSPINMSIFGNDGYIYRAVFVRSNGSTETEELLGLATTVNVIKEAQDNEGEVYTVAPNGDFASFTEMLVALKENGNKKTVYVQGGVYDIFDEMGGAAYMASVDTSANWRTVCNIVPPNTTIVGVGSVTLTWNPTDAEIIDNSHAALFSPLNLSGTCTIKNIRIECSNCRYGIHDETSGKEVYNGVTHVFENVSVVYSASTYGIKYAYGAGHNKNSKYVFKNCLFSAHFGCSWSMHDWQPAGANESSEFVFDNCVFWDNDTNAASAVRFSSSDTVGRLDDVKINGCVFGNLTFGTEGSTAIKQGYKARTMLCKTFSVTYSSLIANGDRIAPTEYLTIS